MKVYQALLSNGDILECDTFAALYRFALRHGKIDMHYGADRPFLARLCQVEYSDQEYLNQYGYMQRELLDRQVLAYLAVSNTGYTVVYDHSVYDIEKGA